MDDLAGTVRTTHLNPVPGRDPSTTDDTLHPLARLTDTPLPMKSLRDFTDERGTNHFRVGFSVSPDGSGRLRRSMQEEILVNGTLVSSKKGGKTTRWQKNFRGKTFIARHRAISKDYEPLPSQVCKFPFFSAVADRVQQYFACATTC
jgi:hypothetical protein